MDTGNPAAAYQSWSCPKRRFKGVHLNEPGSSTDAWVWCHYGSVCTFMNSKVWLFISVTSRIWILELSSTLEVIRYGNFFFSIPKITFFLLLSSIPFNGALSWFPHPTAQCHLNLGISLCFPSHPNHSSPDSFFPLFWKIVDIIHIIYNEPS